jgi:hypothetical protein
LDAIGFTKVEGQINTVEAKLEGKIDSVEAKIEGKIDKVDAKYEERTKLGFWLVVKVASGSTPLTDRLVASQCTSADEELLYGNSNFSVSWF